MAGSPRALTPPTCKRLRRCWRRWRNATLVDTRSLTVRTGTAPDTPRAAPCVTACGRRARAHDRARRPIEEAKWLTARRVRPRRAALWRPESAEKRDGGTTAPQLRAYRMSRAQWPVKARVWCDTRRMDGMQQR